MSIALAAIICIIAILSLIPVSFHNGWKSPSLWLPIVSGVISAAYEFAVRTEFSSENVPIRIDLLFGRPILAFILLTGMCRWLIYLGIIRPGTPTLHKFVFPLQVCGVLFIAGILALWTRPHWDSMSLIIETIIHR